MKKIKFLFTVAVIILTNYNVLQAQILPMEPGCHWQFGLKKDYIFCRFDVGIGAANPIYGKLQVQQSSDASDKGIAVLNSTGQRAIRIWTDDTNSYIYSGGAGTAKLILNTSGEIGIGTTTTTWKGETYKLAVKGKILTSEIKLINIADWPDFVFNPTYKMLTLTELENYIKENKHLPDVPSEKEVKENGINVAEMNALLLRKIEELTLYTIEQQKLLDKQNKKLNKLEKENTEIQEENKTLKSISEKLKELQERVERIETK